MKIIVCTLRIGDYYREITYYSARNKAEYCAKHGYDLRDQLVLLDKHKLPHWNKMLLISELLPNYDYVVWMDADLYIMNLEIKLEDIIHKYQSSNKDIFVSSDANMTNTGVMFFKNTIDTQRFLHLWLTHPSYPGGGNFEQDAFQALHRENVDNCNSYTLVLPQKETNCYFGDYKKGDFILHFAGARGDGLFSMMRQFCPMRMDEDSDGGYNFRMNHLSNMNQVHSE